MINLLYYIDLRGCIWGYFENNFSETNTVTFMQKVIYLRYLPTAKLLSTAGGKDKIKFGMTSSYGEFYAGKLSIKL